MQNVPVEEIDDTESYEETDQDQAVLIIFLLICIASISFPFVAILYPGLIQDSSLLITIIILSNCIPGVVLTLSELRFLICNILMHLM